MTTTPPDSAQTLPRGIHRRLLAGWGAIAARFGSVQTLLILSLFYLVGIGIGALGMRIARHDPLERGGLREPGSAWRAADSAGADPERARQLF